MKIEIKDGHLIERLQEHAANQKTTVDELVQATLLKCDELDLLKNAMDRGPENDPQWGNA